MCVFSCVSLHLGRAFCIMSHYDLILVLVVVHFSLVTTLFCFISLDTLLGNFFVVVLSVNVGVFLCLLASWQGFLHCIRRAHNLK